MTVVTADVVSMDGDPSEGAPIWVWIGLTAIACASFWCQATVTEERLVPALNVIAEHFKIPNDIAGATLMAAGASSPELFSSFVALFITHSSLGLGTIVGSEIFNQLIICAGAVYASKTGTLKLDKVIVTREVGFYALGIILLYVALRDVRMDPDDPDGPEHIYVSFFDACLLFGGYLLYVACCANMESITEWIGAKKPSAGQDDVTDESTPLRRLRRASSITHLTMEDCEDLPFMEDLANESSETSTAVDPSKKPKEADGVINQSFLSDTIRRKAGQKYGALDRPGLLHGKDEIEYNEETDTLEVFMFQKSVFYTMSYFVMNGWHLRWFSISPQEMSSVPDRLEAEHGRMKYPHFSEIFVDQKRLLIKIPNPAEEKRDFMLMAPSKEIFQKVLVSLGKYMNTQSGVEEPIKDEPEGFEDADAHEELIDFPADGSNIAIIFWLLLYPLSFLMHYTLPDVRHLDSHGEMKDGVGRAYMSTFMCLVWLVIGSYAMVASLEALAELMDIPDAVIGFTVSAAGTSLPNYVASKVAAENGFGNQAVSNAFGSNTFNIMVGLGLPWFIYTSVNGFEPYHGLRNDNIIESIVILAVVLAIFVVMMLFSDFVLYKWQGISFVLLYVAYIVYAVAGVYA